MANDTNIFNTCQTKGNVSMFDAWCNFLNGNYMFTHGKIFQIYDQKLSE